jgi:uncharacterized protein (TIGR00369 family)
MKTEMRERMRLFMEEQIPFNRLLGFAVVALEPGFSRFELPFRDEFVGDPFRPALHGGVLSALVDTCGGAALWGDVDVGDRLATVDLRIDYLRPGPLEDLACESRVVRVGNRVGVVDSSAFPISNPDHVIVTGKAVYNIKRSN